MKPGDRVIAKVYGNRKVERIFVELIDSTVVICLEEEWLQANREMRKPTGVGFPIRDIEALNA